MCQITPTPPLSLCCFILLLSPKKRPFFSGSQKHADRKKAERSACCSFLEPTDSARVPGRWLARLAAGRRACGAPGFAANVPGSQARIAAEGRRSAGRAGCPDAGAGQGEARAVCSCRLPCLRPGRVRTRALAGAHWPIGRGGCWVASIAGLSSRPAGSGASIHVRRGRLPTPPSSLAPPC